MTSVYSTVFQPFIAAALHEAVLKAVSGVEKGVEGILKRKSGLKSTISTMERAVKL